MIGQSREEYQDQEENSCVGTYLPIRSNLQVN